MRTIVILWAVALSASIASAGDNWPQFRGPSGDGHSDAVGLPLQWSETQNVRWKTPIHGRGWSSPVVWGDQVWMTTATEDGREMFVVCVDLATGKILHDIRLFADVVVTQEMNPLNTFASPTPSIEQGRVYAHFGTYGTACLDTASGRVLWVRRDIHCDHYRGPGSSPILFRDLLIFPMDGIDVEYVIALDKHSGATRWKVDRSLDFTDMIPDLRKAYSTPLIAQVGGSLQMLSTGAKCTYAYDPATGKELWRVRYEGFSNASCPLFGQGLAYINTGFGKAELWAVRPDGRGDVTDTHVVWRLVKAVPAKPSPLLIGDLIFMVDDAGVASCVEAKTGEIVWQKRIGGQYSASPIFADGRIYCFSHENQTTVFAPRREFQQLAVNELDDGFMASPAVIGNALILRSKTHLYRIEEGR